MNYHYADSVFRKFKLQYAMTVDLFASKKEETVSVLEKERMPCPMLF